MREGNDTLIFEQASPTLLGLAYRLLGSWADAEDAVQDTYLKWRRANKARIENPAGWLTTICTRRCIDLLRSAHRSRVTYVGTWLPEPIYTSAVENAADLETAFLLLLERLTPKERAAFLLYEVFEMPYAEIARTLGISAGNVKAVLFRAGQALASALGDDEIEEGGHADG